MKTAIFDMDGLLIDSEPMWDNAETQVFTSLGVQVSEQGKSKTKSMTTAQCTDFWFEQTPWSDTPKSHVENRVVSEVINQIKRHGVEKKGVTATLQILKNEGYKIGLATNSPSQIATVVLEKLNIDKYFDVVVGADSVNQGKPDPEIYQHCMSLLGGSNEKAIAFEDSVSGMKAAIAAGIKTYVVPNDEDRENPAFQQAHSKLKSLDDFSFA